MRAFGRYAGGARQLQGQAEAHVPVEAVDGGSFAPGPQGQAGGFDGVADLQVLGGVLDPLLGQQRTLDLDEVHVGRPRNTGVPERQRHRDAA